jgi:hypothetical protein
MPLFPTTLLCAALAVAAPPAASPPLQNAAFEIGDPGGFPPGWTLRDFSASQGFTARLVDRAPAAGRLCLEVARKESLTFPFGQYAAVSQAVPAADLRGRRVRFSAAVRTGGLIGFAGAGLFARAHRPDFRPGHCAEMNDRPERGKEWVRRSVVLDVAADAERVEVGCFLHAVGTAWFDDAALEVLGPAGAGNDPPAPLSERGRANVEAFARLLAYVRFFHPSGEAAGTDWGAFAVGHVAYVEAARTPVNWPNGWPRRSPRPPRRCGSSSPASPRRRCPSWPPPRRWPRSGWSAGGTSGPTPTGCTPATSTSGWPTVTCPAARP